MRYLLIGATPFTGYTGPERILALSIRGKTETQEAARSLRLRLYDECGGLVLIVDTQTGEEVSPD